MKRLMIHKLVMLVLPLVGWSVASAVEVDQIDDFESGTTAGWTKGSNSSLLPTNVDTGGPNGADDNFLQAVSTGGLGADSRQVILNRAQWSGNYIAEGIIEIRADMRNMGEIPLFMRVALEGGEGATSWFASSQAIQLPGDGSWHQVTFGVQDSDLTRVSGAQTYSAALSSVVELRILTRQSDPGFRADVVASTLGIDNIEARGAVEDADGDGVPDGEDAFPNDPSETTDTDNDGIGNNADPDDDNDGVLDAEDDFPLGRFSDAGPSYWAFVFIEALARAGITGGCGGTAYCPEDSVTRAQMAVFLERGMKGSEFSPPAATGNLFLDVSASDFAAAFIEQLFLDGITSGCGGNDYCPTDGVTRAQMAVFLLRAKHGSGYTPPAPTGVFGDVDLSYWAVSWIEQLAAEAITSGCGGGNYCPDNPVTRAQMAVFLVRTFGL